MTCKKYLVMQQVNDTAPSPPRKAASGRKQVAPSLTKRREIPDYDDEKRAICPFLAIVHPMWRL